jgi:hypothetical protein
MLFHCVEGGERGVEGEESHRETQKVNAMQCTEGWKGKGEREEDIFHLPSILHNYRPGGRGAGAAGKGQVLKNKIKKKPSTGKNSPNHRTANKPKPKPKPKPKEALQTAVRYSNCNCTFLFPNPCDNLGGF